jgi:hypothetical protein
LGEVNRMENPLNARRRNDRLFRCARLAAGLCAAIVSGGCDRLLDTSPKADETQPAYEGRAHQAEEAASLSTLSTSDRPRRANESASDSAPSGGGRFRQVDQATRVKSEAGSGDP